MTREPRKYRKCHCCGLEWNVSRIEPGGKKYVCWVCEKKKKNPDRSSTPVRANQPQS